jgi:hypothetical protein
MNTVPAPMFTCIRRNAVLVWIDGRDVVVSPIPPSFYSRREVAVAGVVYKMKQRTAQSA